MKRVFALLTAASILVAAPMAVAQVAAVEMTPTMEGAVIEPASAASPLQAENVALARRYFEVIGFEGQLGSILANLTSPEQLGARESLTSQERETIVASAAEAMDEAIPMMIDEAARITARTFTSIQLKDMIAFYETDSGKAIADKTPVLPPMASQLVLVFAPVIRADVITRACAKMDCQSEPRLKV